MATSASELLDTAEKLIFRLRADIEPIGGRIGRIQRYLDGKQDLPYIPRGAKNEYRVMAQKSITNWLPQVSNTYSQGLFVDGYRIGRSDANVPTWQTWQDNGMDARQTIVIRSALDYGIGYGVTLPGDSAPVMKALPATRATAYYEDPDDEWPIIGLWHKAVTLDGDDVYAVLDDEFLYTVELVRGVLKVTNLQRHGFGVVPMVRFRTRLGEMSRGIIEPLIPAQDQINETVFGLRMALQYAAFRQRWATGLAIPTDEDGNAVEPFEAAVDRLWVTDNPEARFGDFAQTETRGHLEAYVSQVRTLAGQAQVSPNLLTGDLINLSAEALAMLRSQTDLQIGEFKTLLGESFEQWIRLTALADGDVATAQDTSAEVRWRDTEPRSFEGVISALAMMVEKLAVPAEAVWDKIPNTTDQDIERFKNARESDGLTQLMDALVRQGEPAEGPEQIEAA